MYEVEHEGGVDYPDPGGKVASALVHERIPAVAGAVAHIAGDAELERPALGAGGERVELGVEPLELAAQDRGELALAFGAEVGAGVLDLLCGVGTELSSIRTAYVCSSSTTVRWTNAPRSPRAPRCAG